MATTFVEIDNRYYNSQTLGKAFTKEIVDSETGETTTLYYAQTLGGQDVEIDQQTYQDIIDGEYSPSTGGGGDAHGIPVGGTLGQSLKKRSNTDYDVEWSNDDEGMENPMTSTGDIIYGGVDGDPTSLAIGAQGQVLTVKQNGLGPEWEDIPVPIELAYSTIEPTSDNTSGNLKVVILSSEPSTKYDGYIYIITGSAQ